MKILVINGPNLNMLGIREPSVYGSSTLEDLNNYVRSFAKSINVEVDFFQSNCEGEIIGSIHSVLLNYDACLINAGAYTHYSYAIYDAIKSVSKPFVEVHLSDVNSREDFRKISVIKPACVATFCGLGQDSYTKGIEHIVNMQKTLEK